MRGFSPYSKKCFLTLFAASSLGFACHAYAQTIDILSPLGNWVSESGQLDLGGGKTTTYCAISNTYRDNGRLEFYGVQGKLAAIKVDFPGKTFAAGQNLDATLKMPGTYKADMKGVVVGTSTLIINVKGDDALVAALHNGQLFYVGLAGQDYPFSLSGINKFGERLMTCRNESWEKLLHGNVFPDDAAQASAAHVQARNIQGTESPLNKGSTTLDILKSPPMKGDGILVEELVEDEVVPQIQPPPAPVFDPAPSRSKPVVPSENASLQPAVTSPQFAAQEQLPAVPPRGSVIASMKAPPEENLDALFVPPVKSMADPPQLSEMQPPQAEVASAVLMKAVPPPVPLYEAPLVAPKPEILQTQVSSSKAPVWRALKGSSLREVLALWSLDNGVELIWNAEEQYRVRETFSMNSSYENAVETLLKQYELGLLSPDVRRPVGQLYVDPQQKKKVLVIRSQAG